MQKQPEKAPRLITISVSHYCEKARWALERLEVPYIEERHIPLFHRLATRKSGGGQTTPVLVTEAGTLSDSSDILQYLDGMTAESTKFYPADPKLRREVEKLEDLFNKQLGPSIRLWAYFYLLDNRQLMRRLWCDGVAPIEQALFPIVFPLIREAARRGYNITAESSASAHDKIKRIFENVNARLADGRSYLVGDRFSAADLTFACLAAPAVLPAEYGASLPHLDELPDEIAGAIKELRETPAGAYILRLFREERQR
ncbi:glutathione S-transferase family protein [Coleofasciculus sp. FACHB-1120]|uniref:glutathione S-transferase family protein n=1 Tax=Coleofasciculus sp. FACHB-1120 TaxID=2692783 RepID=UPI001689BBDB|nr:glutathione S-transferase family protein [Coleofasciculus sp. FACHB-1120]MBD2741427.1 glutathione S-transferase family protein [Coleofasciculus sp. FACHB-1120]